MVRGSLPHIAVTMASGKEVHGSFSLIVDDVDSPAIHNENREVDPNAKPCNNSNTQDTSSQTSLDSLNGPEERIKQMQVEAETRRKEFARLLEEHAQVVRKLKMMEAEGELSSASGNVVAATHA